MNLLCRVVTTIPVFDFQMFLGEIVATFVNEQCITDGNPDPKKIAPIILMGKNYWGLGETAGMIFREAVKYGISNKLLDNP
jgi:flavin reductase (DIM6/NTAB) family NADH-FMN oxidoreductase RutF